MINIKHTNTLDTNLYMYTIYLEVFYLHETVVTLLIRRCWTIASASKHRE